MNWSTYSLCSHTLAVSENIEHLKEFLAWFKKQKRVPNLTTITNINMPQNKGRKSGTRKRKGAANTTPTEGMPVVASRVVPSQPHQQPRATNNVCFQTGVTSTSAGFHRDHEVTLASSTFWSSMAPLSVSFQLTMASPSSVFFQPTMASSSSGPFQPTMASLSSVPFRPVITSASVPLLACNGIGKRSLSSMNIIDKRSLSTWNGTARKRCR